MAQSCSSTAAQRRSDCPSSGGATCRAALSSQSTCLKENPMRSIIYHRYGEPADVLQLTEAPALPAPGKGEVLIRTTSRPIHPGDLLGVRGFYRPPGNTTPVAPDGARPGFEGTGTIEAVGPDVDPAAGLIVGKRVAFFPARWAWSDKVLASARFVTPIPDEILESIAAQLHVNPLTSAMLVRAAEKIGISPGDVVVLTAAASQVAKLVAAILLSKGYAPIGVVRSTESKASLTAKFAGMPVIVTDDADLPADEVTDTSLASAPVWSEELRAAAKGRPIRTVIDPVGGKLASTIVSRMDGGTLISYGDLSGGTVNVPALAFSVRGITMTGVSVGGWGNLPDHVRAADLATARALGRSAAARLAVAREVDFSDISQAARHSERPGKGGTVLLTSKLGS
jgi:NADPH:quinone reductase-like Zn-dependent oxidoreductase